MLIVFLRINRNFNMILYFTLMRDEFDNVQVEKPPLEKSESLLLILAAQISSLASRLIVQ